MSHLVQSPSPSRWRTGVVSILLAAGLTVAAPATALANDPTPPPVWDPEVGAYVCPVQPLQPGRVNVCLRDVDGNCGNCPNYSPGFN